MCECGEFVEKSESDHQMTMSFQDFHHVHPYHTSETPMHVGRNESYMSILRIRGDSESVPSRLVIGVLI